MPSLYHDSHRVVGLPARAQLYARSQIQYTAIDPELAAEAWGEGDPLTDRKRQVLRLASDGKSGPEIAEELHLSEGTVRNYPSEAISKVGGRNRVDAARIARAKGWL